MSTHSKTALLGAAIGLLTAGAVAQEAPAAARSNTLTTTGSGEAKSKPDIAYVTVGVITQSKRAQEAAQANAAATGKVMAALRQQGIAEKDLQTSNFSVQPMYENQPNRELTIQGYQVSNQVRATVRALDKIGSVIDAALDAGANNVQGVFFGLDKRAEAEDEALNEAVHDARRKAETLAKAAGVRIVGVQQIQEGGFVRPMPMMAENFGAMAKAVTPIAPGELTVSANVTIVFSILPAERGAQAPSPPARRPSARRAAR